MAIKTVDVTIKRAAKVWFAYTWRYIVFGWGISVLVMILAMFIPTPTGAENWPKIIADILFLPIHVVAGIWSMYHIIGNDFHDCQLVLQETYWVTQMRELEEGAKRDAGSHVSSAEL